MPSPSVFLPIVYLSLPIAAVGFAAVRVRQTRDLNPVRDTLMTFSIGAVGGLIVAACHRWLAFGEIPTSEIAVTCYWAMAVASAARAFNAALKWSIDRLTRARSRDRSVITPTDVVGSIVRSIILLAVVIPYVGAMLLVYRPHVVFEGTPLTLIGKSYDDIAFASTDGLNLRGWWIPAGGESSRHPGNSSEASQRTIILCHGFGADKAANLRVVRGLADADFNILAFDFRGHGQSDGQLCTFGDFERRDVLGAVRWLRKNHPAESQKIFGVGIGLGAAALVAAAADPNEGQAFDAIALFSPYDRLTNWTDDLSGAFHVPTVGWTAKHLSLPMAGWQLGTPLADFSPADYADKIAPRPMLVIAADRDPAISLSLSQQFYEEASQPKYSFWVKNGKKGTMLFKNENVSRALRVFFETARDVL